MEIKVFLKELESALMQRGILREVALRHSANLMRSITNDDLSEIEAVKSSEEIALLADSIAAILNEKRAPQSTIVPSLENHEMAKELEISYCTNCGQKILDGAKFCAKCGMPVQHDYRSTQYDESNNSKRKTVYEGTVHKCPNCGEVLASFMRNCPSCGMEIRDANINNDILNFVNQLNAVNYELSNTQGLLNLKRRKATEEKKISIIRNFPVPNTAEAMLEFMVLATSNIDVTAYGSDSGNKQPLADAWLSKIEQINKKAKLSNGSNETKQKISDLYNDCQLKIKKEKKSGRRKLFLTILASVFYIPLLIVMAIIINISSIIHRNNQIKKLNILSKEIEQCITDHEYLDAAIKLNNLFYTVDKSPSNKDKELEKEWAGIRLKYIRQIETSSDEQILSITPPTTPSQALGQNANELKRVFETYGFVNVTISFISDLLSDNLNLDNTVLQLSINGSDSFTRNDSFAFNDPVLIIAHGIQYVQTPDSSRHLVGLDAEDVKGKFIAAGFKNIEGVDINLPEDLFSKMNGKVVDISINGDSDFSSEKQFVADAKVIIRYK